jgi:hypothetical protein
MNILVTVRQAQVRHVVWGLLSGGTVWVACGVIAGTFSLESAVAGAFDSVFEE